MIRSLPALFCLLVLSAGCGPSRHEAARHHADPIPHVVAPLQGPAHDLDHQLSVASKVAVGATGLAVAGGIFALIELHISLMLVVASVGACIGSWAVLALMRLLVPILAIGAPFVAAGIVLAALAAGLWYWKRRQDAKKAAAPVALPAAPEPPKAAPAP